MTTEAAVQQETQAAQTPSLVANETVRQPTAAEMTPHQTFLETLPEAYRADPLFKNFTNLDDMAKSYVSAAKMVGIDKAQLLRLPSEDTPEAMGEVWNKLGRPESPDKYEIKAFEKVKDYIDDSKVAQIKDIAHKHGVSGKALEALAEWYASDLTGAVSGSQEAMDAEFAEYQAATKAEFGAAYEERMSMAQRAVKTFGGEDLIKVIAENEVVFEHPAVIKAFAAMGEQMAKIAEQTKEDNGFLPNNAASGHMTPSEAKAELAALEGGPDFMKIISDPTHPQRQFILEKRAKLFAYAYDTAPSK